MPFPREDEPQKRGVTNSITLVIEERVFISFNKKEIMPHTSTAAERYFEMSQKTAE